VGFLSFVVVVVVGYFLIFACNCCGSSAVMGILVNPREWWSQKRKELESRGQRPPPAAATSFMIPAIIEQPLYPKQKQVLDKIAEEKLKRATKCADDGIKAGVRAAIIVAIATTIPTVIIARKVPWAKANLNYAGQAFIISSSSAAAYFIVAEQTILECIHKASYAATIERERAAARSEAA
jgi:hypothetical protein